MAIQVKLSDILAGMEFLSDEHSSYLNVRTGEVVTVSDDDFRAAEEEDIDGESEEDRAAFPRGDWEDEEIDLARQILQDDQQVFLALPTKFDIDAYRYRDKALKGIAVEWCAGHGIAYVDDTPDRAEPAPRKQRLYEDLLVQLRALLGGERDPIANAANLAALLYRQLPDVNWAGFYLFKEGELVVGPFQGKPACTRIALGKGVCGTAAQGLETIIVPDVHQFPGHVACDEASNAEIVVPIVHQGRLVGVLDLDSPVPGRFDEEDRAGLEVIVRAFVEGTKFS